MGIDPVGVDENNVHSHNRYAYANNNPYKFVDPDGRVAILALIPPALQLLSVGITSYETTTVGLNVANGNQTLGQAVREEAPGIAIGVVTGGAGKVAGKVLKGAANKADNFFDGSSYTDKVKGQMKLDDFHAFPESVKGFKDSGKVSDITGGDGIVRSKLEIPGGYKGKEGNFEFIKEPNGQINHRKFEPKRE